MRLRQRFVLPLVVVALVLSVTTLAGYALYRDTVLAQERADLERTGESVATQLDVVLSEKRQLTRLAATDEALTAHGSRTQASALSSFVLSTTFSGASVIAANGTMTARYAQGVDDRRPSALVGRSFADRTYFQRAMTGTTYVSDPVRTDSGARVVTVSTPLRRDGEIVGTFNAAFLVREGDFSSVVRTSSSATRGVRVVADGTTVYSQGPTANATQRRLLTNATVPSTGWTVSVTSTRGAFASRLWVVTLTQAAAYVLVLVSLVGFGWWISQEYIGNLERLSDGFSSLVDGDYGTRVALSGATEWDQLAAGFNELSETLAQRRTEVTVLNRVLRHNLRNAMTVVVGSADRIAAATDDEDVVADARRIHRRGESLLDLAEHARAIESSLGDRDPGAAVRPADAVVEEVAAVLSDEFPAATVTTSTAGVDGVRVPDSDFVAVVLDEVGRNGIVHDDTDDPRVEFSASADGERVRFAVADDGPGLPSVERRVLTEPFVETPTHHGSGLGLWMVTWLVARVDGDVQVTTGGGTRVEVSVPRAPDEGDDQPAGPPDESAGE